MSILEVSFWGFRVEWEGLIRVVGLLVVEGLVRVVLESSTSFRPVFMMVSTSCFMSLRVR